MHREQTEDMHTALLVKSPSRLKIHILEMSLHKSYQDCTKIKKTTSSDKVNNDKQYPMPNVVETFSPDEPTIK